MSARQQIELVLAEVSAAIARGASGREVGALMYHTDATVVGEGLSIAARSLAEFEPTLSSYIDSWGPGAQVSFKVIEPLLSNGELMVSMAVAECRTAQPGAEVARFRFMSGWRRGPSGWRIALEMFGSGDL